MKSAEAGVQPMPASAANQPSAMARDRFLRWSGHSPIVTFPRRLTMT
jgi:hypothetical protein